MKLPIAANIKPEYTGYRLPRREPLSLGLYAEQDEGRTLNCGYDEVWRTEVRIGAQTRIDRRMPREQIERIHVDTKGLIMRHVYGPIYEELNNVMKDMMDAGIYRGDPAYDRVGRMRETLHDAFRGDC